MKMKNRFHRYDINRPRSRNEHKYDKYKKYVTMMMLIGITNYWCHQYKHFRKKTPQ